MSLGRGVLLLGACLALAAGARAATPPLIERAVMAGDAQALEEALRRLRGGGAGDAQDVRALYLRAYTAWRLSYFHERSSATSQGLLEEAERDLTRLLALEPENPEALALKATVDGSRITGLWSGLRRGPRSARAYDRALELAPDNPRVVMLVGISRLFRPRSFGGGVSRAEDELLRAQELFAGESQDEPWPNWGRAEVQAWLGQAALRKGDLATAAACYEEALAREPDYHWVRRSLLPELRQRLEQGPESSIGE